MRGLPYDCTAQQVLDFFAAGEQPCRVRDGADGVLFVRRADGRATGDAFVLFSEEADAPKALSRHRHSIGSRYIELFRSTTAEVQQVLNRSLEHTTPKVAAAATAPPLLPPLPAAAAAAVPLLPQHVITSGTRKDCVRLRGLPYEAQVEHILDFLGDFAKSIVLQGVHMVYNAAGQPSGEAFIQMDSEQSAFITAQQKHHRYMVFGKKQRYIEVFQCSGEDMNLILTGAAAAPTSPSSPASAKQPAAPLLSPGTPTAHAPPLWDPHHHQQLLAQHIAQQMLLARQEAALLQQHHHPALLQQHQLLQHQLLPQPLVLLPPRHPPPVGYHRPVPVVPQHVAVKRAYGDAFAAEQTNSVAKRAAYHQVPPQGNQQMNASAAAAAAAALYPHLYPGI